MPAITPQYLAWIEKLAADRNYVVPAPSATERQAQAEIDAERYATATRDAAADRRANFDYQILVMQLKATVAEVSRLSIENSRLRQELDQARQSILYPDGAPDEDERKLPAIFQSQNVLAAVLGKVTA